MKLNWGWGVVIVFCVFGVTMIGLVIKMFTVPVNMVSKDYYAEEQRYEETVQKKENTKKLSAAPVIALNREKGTVDIILPSELKKTEGNIRFFRPSDSRLDFNVKLDLNAENTQNIDASRIVKGRWIIQVNFSDTGVDYLFEKALVL
ncbi:FixH family protein [Flammeovirga sp. SJP92]|uniref:FixH family protein n=1 Tax=Flammeovirga sp. SJP92 TaxID=1775430 RepID=UPI0007930DBB|nr:FixH family protein [Flammeovirga sp. SJP92]KXX69556.1 hypothetical protein AVL50_15920 [Flammeovirga sp. SJP92]